MAMMKVAVATAEAPAAIGPYTQAVRVGEMLYTSGQIALDPKTMALVEGGISEQTEQVLENLKAVLAAAGSDLSRFAPFVVEGGGPMSLTNIIGRTDSPWQRRS